MKSKINFIIVLAFLGLFATTVWAESLKVDIIENYLKDRIKQLQSQHWPECRGELIYAIQDLQSFYRLNHYQPVWLNTENAHRPFINDLLSAIQSSRQEGLCPENYHLETIKTIQQKINKEPGITSYVNISTLLDLEVICTDAFLLLASHFSEGSIIPANLYNKWVVVNSEVHLAEILQKAINNNSIESSLKRLLPPQAGYSNLRKELIRYRRLASEYEPKRIPSGPLIQKGDKDSRVPVICRTLKTLGDLAGQEDCISEQINDHLVAGVVRFQKRHGLKVDGIIGEQTLAALNVSLEARIRTIKVNLERWRWQPQDFGKRYLLVNIANYSLTVIESGKPVMDMKVVIGRKHRKTPVFHDRLQYIVINPYWNVPRSIAVKDILPKIKKDKQYLSRNRFTLFAGWGNKSIELDPLSIDWSEVTPENFKYHLRKAPGPSNPLGRIKFMFPNRFSVYLHDTPAKNLFQYKSRGFSSGCIRVEKPIDLAEYVMKGQSDWSREKILEAIAQNNRISVPVETEINIHIMYRTAWVDRKGIIQFRKDIYNRDKPLAKALNQQPWPHLMEGKKRDRYEVY